MAQEVREFMVRLELLTSDIRNRLELAKEALSQADKAISVMYHEIEITNFDVTDGYRIARKLQDALLVRRTVKLEIELLQMLSGQLTSVCQRIHHKIEKHARILTHPFHQEPKKQDPFQSGSRSRMTLA